MRKKWLTLLALKKTDKNVEIVKIINVFKKNWTIAILMRKDVPNPGKLVWGPYNQPFLSNIDFSIDFGGKTYMRKCEIESKNAKFSVSYLRPSSGVSEKK